MTKHQSVNLKLVVLSTLALGLLAAVLYAQTPNPVVAKDTTKQKEPPKLSAEMQAKFWKAQAEMQRADDVQKAATQDNQQKHVAYNAVVTEMQGVCGGEFVLNMSTTGDPECQAKTPAPKPAEVKK